MRRFLDTVGQVWQAITANKLRSFLTMFGIAWGVGSLLVLVGLGEGFRSGQHRNLASFGNDLVSMWSATVPALPNQHTGMRPYKLTPADEEDIRALPEVRDVTATLQRSDLYQVSPYSNTSGPVWGVEPNYPKIRFVHIKEGRFVNQADSVERRRVVVLGSKSAEILFPGHLAVGDNITINGTRFTVIGLADKINRGNNDGDNQRVYIPLSTMIELYAMTGENIPHDALTSINYQPATPGNTSKAVPAVHRIIGRNHGFDPTLKDAFDEFDTIKEQKMISVIFNSMDYFLGGVGIVTLALGAVGIVNIMLVAVTERTREIGLRMALGATKRSILTQFFLEGLILTGVSGLVGIAVSAGFMGLLQALFTGKVRGFDPPRLAPWSAAVALIALVISGIIAGIYPASKAAELEPVEALRRE